MSESSSDDFSDIEYTQTKNENISDVDSFEDLNEQSTAKLYQLTKTQNSQLDSDPNDSFGSNEFEKEHDAEIPMTMDRNTENVMETIGDKSNMTGRSDHNSDLYYNARDYDSLDVNNEIRRLFEYIERFEYKEIELESQLKPFIPDYIPSIGNVDCFIKPTLSTKNYDESTEKLGIHYLDEPILNQSDPSTFYLKLTNESKQVSLNKHTKISSIVDAEKNTNKIRNWIANFKKVKNKSLSNTVCIDNPNNMPKPEELLQPFLNDKFNQFINEKCDIMPSYNIDLSLAQYAKIICNILDIPVQNNDIKTSLHLLFSTYAALKSASNAYD